MQFQFSKEFLRTVHLYLRHDDFIDGQAESVVKYLVPHLSEKSQAVHKDFPNTTVGALGYGVRTERLENDNFCDSVLMFWLAYLSKEVTRKEQVAKSEVWEPILTDLDGEGLGLKTFIRHAFWDFLGYGRFACLVEGPMQVAPDAEGARAAGERSYATPIEPWRVCKLERFKEFGPKKGKIREVAYIESAGKENDGEFMIVRRFWIESQGDNYQSERLKIKGNIFSQVTGKVPANDTWAEPRQAISFDGATGGFDEIPFVVLGSGPKEDSVLYSVVPKNREHLNKKSAFDMTLYNQAFQQKFFFGVDPDQATHLTERNGVFFREEAGSVTVVEPVDPTASQTDLDNIKRDGILKGIVRVAQQHQLMTKAVTSADSKREDNRAFEEYLEYVAERVEKCMNEIMFHLHRFEFSADPVVGEYELGFDKKFRAIPTDQELLEDQQLFGMLQGFNQAGREVQAEMIVSKIASLRVESEDRETAEQLKADLKTKIRAEGAKAPVSPVTDITQRILERRERLKQQGNPAPEAA